MRTIYVVEGETGEYDDHYTWQVCAYVSEEKAKERVQFLNELLETNGLFEQGKVISDYCKREKAVKIVAEHENGDKYLSVDYTGSSYSYYELELIEE